MRIEVPTTPPQRGGILNVITPTNINSVAAFDGVTYPGTLHGVPQLIPSGTDKNFDVRVAPVTGDPFTIYRGVDLSLFDPAPSDEVAAELFGNGETVAVEEGVLTLLNAAATDITPVPGTEVSPLTGVAALEQYAAENYGGLPIFHVSKYGAAFLADAGAEVDTGSWKLHTQQGSPIVNGAGYSSVPLAALPNADDFWIYVSGQVRLFRTDPVTTTARDTTTNRVLTLVERTYIPVVEHFVAAILVKPV